MRKVFLGLFLLYTLSLQAQQAKVTLSNEFEIKDIGEIYRIGNFIYRVEENEVRAQLVFFANVGGATAPITLHKYDTSMKEIKKNELDGGKKSFGPFTNKLVKMGDKLLLFYYKYPNKDSLKLFVSQIDLETLAITNTKEIFSISQKNFGFIKALSTSTGDNQLHTCLSPDTSKLLVVHPNVKVVASCVIDKNFEITNTTFSPSPAVKDFVVNQVFIDNSGNKYVSYEFAEDKRTNHGIFMQNTAGKQLFKPLAPDRGLDKISNEISFAASTDNSKVYAYTTYSAQFLDEGILLSTLDAAKVMIGVPKLYPYSYDFRQTMFKSGFTYRSTIRKVAYNFLQLDNGTIALTGVAASTSYNSKNQPVDFSGPVVAAFINNNGCVFSAILRGQPGSQASDNIAIKSGNNIICLYTDIEKNIKMGLSERPKQAGDAKELVLAMAVINSDGTIVSREKILDNAIGKNYCFTSEAQHLSNNNLLIPIGRTRTGFSLYSNYIVQWATVAVQ